MANIQTATQYVPEKKQAFSIAINTPTYQKLINRTLGDPNRAKRFVAAITSAVAVNPVLQECTAKSILAGALLGESLNLQPSPQLGQFYLVPYDVTVKDENGKAIRGEDGKPLKEKRASFILGYKGLVQLALRSGYYRFMNVIEVKHGELVGFDPFAENYEFTYMKDPVARRVAPTVGYAAMFEYLNGFRKVIYWTREEMLDHADRYSPAFSAATYEKIKNGEIPDSEMWKYSSFWYKDFDAMAKKTMLRQLISHWGVMTSELAAAFERDEEVVSVDENGGFSQDIATIPSVDTPQIAETAEIADAEPISFDDI